MRSQLLKSFALLCVAAGSSLPAAAQAYKVTNIVSDGSVAAPVTDPNFINPWAISTSGTWWISTAGSGYNYVISSAGVLNFKVIVPTAATGTTPGYPAGSVTTGGAVGMVIPAPNSTKASFLFSTLDGTIAAWNSKLGTANAISTIVINNASAGASYPGLAILNIATAGVTTASYILAPNFGTGNAIEVYDSNFKLTKLAGAFADPNLPTNYAPYSVHVYGTKVYVTYALRTAAAPFLTVNGPGNGIVSVFDNTGTFVARLVTGGNLNAPWGVAFAPAGFGIFSGDLLIGNFGDGIINVYDPTTFAYLGQLIDSTGKPLVYASLWELLPGGTPVTGTTAVSGGNTSTVYFTAGLAGQVHGLFAGITNAVTTGATPTFGFSTTVSSATVPAGSSAQAAIAVGPVNGFSGTVSLSCNGLPIGASCNFSSSQLNVSATAPATSTLTISTTKRTASLQPLHPGVRSAAGITSAMLLPFASVLLFRRRRSMGSKPHMLRLLGVLVVLAAAGSLMVGCSNDLNDAITPPGQSFITVTATSGAITQQSLLTLTVK